MSEQVIEYLIQIDNKTAFFDNEDSLKRILGFSQKFTFEADTIKYENIVVDYKVKLNKNGEERVFELKIIYKEEDVETQFQSCLDFRRELRATMELLKEVQVFTFWDNLSFNQSRNAYPLIYEVENLMRKLITKFMVVNVGEQWTQSDLHEDIKKQARGGISAGEKIDVLYQLDFKYLADVLLKPNKAKIKFEDIVKVYQKIAKAKDSSELDINELKSIVILSNWQKYFSTMIQYDGNKLKNHWERLYELRCIVAHNKFLTDDDYQEIITLTEGLKAKLQDAIEKLDDVEVSEEDKEDIIENVNDDIFNQFIESEVNDFNSDRQASVNNDSRIGSHRMANLMPVHQLTEITRIIVQAQQMLGQMGMGIAPGQNRIADITRGMGMAAPGQNRIADVTRGMGMTAPGQNPRTREARPQVNDEVVPKEMDKKNDKSENLRDVQAIKDEEMPGTPIQTEGNLISETENIEEDSLKDET